MPTTFNADEIYAMAEEMERNAAIFYHEAARKASDEEAEKLLLSLADMEDEHYRVFADMRRNLPENAKSPTVYDPDNQAAAYLQTMADSRGYEGRISPAKKLTGKETIQELVDIALNSEKESVVFYVGLRSLVSEKAGRNKVDDIINEEIGHIAALNKKKASLHGK